MSDRYHGNVKAGATSVSLPVLLLAAADSTELTGKVAADVTASYWRQGGTRTAITPSDLGSVNAAWSSGGWKEVDATNQAGLYRLDVPDAAFASGADWAIVSVKVASAFVYHERVNIETAGSAEVYSRLGAPAGASVSADVAAIQSDTNDLRSRLPAALVSGRIDASVGAYASGLAPLQPTVSGRTLDVSAGGEAGIDWANVGSPTTAVVLSGTTVGTLTTYAGNTPQTGDAFARIGATGSGLTALASAANLATLAGYVDTEVAAVKAVTDQLGTALVLDGSVYQFTANALELAPSGGGGGEVTGFTAGALTAIEDAVWNAAVADHQDDDTYGVQTLVSGGGGGGDPWSTALPGSYGAGTAGRILGDVGDRTGTSGVAVAAGSKSGYALSATGLDAIPLTAPTGVPTTFRQAMVMIYRRFFKRVTKDGSEIVTYADNNTSPITTQAYTAAESDEEVGAAS